MLMKKLLTLLLCLTSIAHAQPRVKAFYQDDPNGALRSVSLLENGNVCAEKAMDDTLRQRLVSLAMQEWQKFGEQIYDVSSRVPFHYPGGEYFELVPQEDNPAVTGVTPRLLRIGKKEDDKTLDAAIASYWATVPQGDYFINRQNKVWEAASTAGWADAWSSAFISWVMCEAGVPQNQFKRAASHIGYVNGIVENPSIYKAVDVKQAGVPKAGDLICADRNKEEPYTGLQDHLDNKEKLEKAYKFRPLHCDLVVKRDWEHNRIYAIGGNVQDSVTLTVARITKTGEGETEQFHLEQTPHRNWFVVLKLQTGGESTFQP